VEITIKIDSREQQPYKFTIPCEVGKLDAGDYSVVGLEDYVAIERKTADDLISCLTTGRERFERELYRGRALDYFALVIEANLKDLANGNYRSQMNPKSAIQSLLAFSIRYRLPVFFVGSRRYGARVIESLLQKYAREVEKRFEQISGTLRAQHGAA
jgi:ERCC4-type nuclease